MAKLFGCMGLAIVILALRVDIIHHNSMKVINSLYITFWYIFTIGIWFGWGTIFGRESYNWIKKNYLKRYIKNDYLWLLK